MTYRFPFIRRVFILPALLSLSLGCATKEGPQCAEVSAHYITLVNAELAKDGDPARLKTARANLPTLQNALLKACQQQEWDKKSRQCILDASTADETQECAPALPSAARNESSPTDNPPVQQ